MGQPASGYLSLKLSDIPENQSSALAHFGVKGMRWGVRKNRGDSSDGSNVSDHTSSDAREADMAFAKAKKHGTGSLSNQEMRSLIDRLNMEQQYDKLTNPASEGKITDGHARVKKLLALGKTANDVHKFVNSPIGKGIRSGMKGKKRKAAKATVHALVR